MTAHTTGGRHRCEPLSAREWLRQETAGAHRAVEALPRMRRVLGPGVTHQDYAAVLQGFLPVHEDFEPRVAARAGWTPGTSEGRVRALREDLMALRVAPPNVRQREAPPEFTDKAAALGACYVLEGSFLGGVVIAGHLRARLGNDLPLRYFGAEGVDTARRWRAFLAFLEDALREEQARRAAIAGARDAYRWLQSVLP